ncbi:50S ribosomal protein L20 [Candidatus Berkelbacteria bacterium RIFOXYA2_FULL_43_10]|uniref:Large ribosomal subunit protein bL20 n=1 Tax=Candidatus Berkelbacteria bacterium RIFOXYA2_FULL_43_10 TaxID=1797472 RepID=A0A1F5ECT8_9BACT|nr:MAG: 50S ribosomal protein L20 [Candidatus Berkelbacteria bacterium RIFOXYA2_FULL_43_10]
MRVKRGTTRRAKHKKIIKLAKGYIGRRKSVFKLAKQAVYKAGQHAYRDRKNKKRTMRSLWIINLNAVAHEAGMSYSTMIKKLKDSKIEINRKILADIAENNPSVMNEIINKIK